MHTSAGFDVLPKFAGLGIGEINLLVAGDEQNTGRAKIGQRFVDADGLPDVPLTLFANDLLKSLSPASVPIYMREVLAAFDWAQSDEIVRRNHWSLFGPPPEVRNVLREYLTVAAKCKLTTRADRLGVKVTYVCQTRETGINIRILLAAFRRFYDHLISADGHEVPVWRQPKGWRTKDTCSKSDFAINSLRPRKFKAGSEESTGWRPPSGTRKGKRKTSATPLLRADVS